MLQHFSRIFTNESWRRWLHPQQSWTLVMGTMRTKIFSIISFNESLSWEVEFGDLYTADNTVEFCTPNISMTTDGDGIARTTLDRKPFAVVASKGDQKGSLRMRDPNSLSLSASPRVSASAASAITTVVGLNCSHWVTSSVMFEPAVSASTKSPWLL